MNAEELKPFIEAIYTKLPHLQVVVAGGLGPRSLDLLNPLQEYFPQLSIDAQGKLRESGSALDPIDWSLALEYLQIASHKLAGK